MGNKRSTQPLPTRLKLAMPLHVRFVCKSVG
ncbi:Uncharacterised protein [Vibrio cholerae]|nr:Uncharacterised protein [Vibrio cholerae]